MELNYSDGYPYWAYTVAGEMFKPLNINANEHLELFKEIELADKLCKSVSGNPIRSRQVIASIVANYMIRKKL